MQIKKLLFPLGLTGILIFLVWIPFQYLLPGFDEEIQLLFKRLINGSLVILFGWVMIRYLKLQQTGYLHTWSVSNIRALWPLLGTILLLLLLQYNRISSIQEKAGILLFVLFIVIIKTAAEEVLFRGVMQTWYMKEGLNPRRAVFFTSLFFSSVHVVNFFTHGDWVSLICQVIFAFFMGLLLGAVNVITRNILLCCILHAVVNIPAALQQLEKQKELVPGQTDTPTPFGEGLVSILFFCLVYSPLILLALYYFFHPKTAKASGFEV